MSTSTVDASTLHTNLGMFVRQCMEFAIKRTFTTCLHTPFTEVPERGAIGQPFARGRNKHTATAGVSRMMMSAGLSKQLGDQKNEKNKTKKHTKQNWTV